MARRCALLVRVPHHRGTFGKDVGGGLTRARSAAPSVTKCADTKPALVRAIPSIRARPA